MYINLSDSLNLASKLSLKRLTNAYRIYSSFIHSRKSKTPEIKGFPISLSIEPTTACNLRCPECPSGLRAFSRPTGMLSPDLFDKLLSEVAETLIYLIFYFQGEPYLHPQLLNMVRKAHDLGIYTATSTNAHFLDEETARETVKSGLDRLIISIDGATQETYSAYRKNGELSKVLAGTQEIIRQKRLLKSKKPHVIWQFLVVKPNEHEVDQIKKLGRVYGVDRVAFKTAQLYDFENGNELMPSIDKYSRYRRTGNGSYQLKNSLRDECWKMWHSSVITWDGRVVPCCFDKDAHHVLGNTSKSDFREIWLSDPYENFRKSLLTSRTQLDMCKNCTEGTRVWA